MYDELILVKIDSNYCNYLRKFDTKVPYNYNEKETRPFVGVLFFVNGCMYFAPLSSPKPKHIKIKSNLDFFKLNGGKLGAINFNNMIPVMHFNVHKIDLNVDISDNRERKYLNLLKKQIFWLNRHSENLYSKSSKLYFGYINNTLNENIRIRCCNFPLLEDKCLEYNSVNEVGV